MTKHRRVQCLQSMGHECLTKGTPKRGSLQSDQFRAPGANKMELAAEGREERQKGQAHHSPASSRSVLCVYTHPLLHQMSMKGAPWARPHSASEPQASALGSTRSSGERKYRAPGGERQMLGKSFSSQDLENRWGSMLMQSGLPHCALIQPYPYPTLGNRALLHFKELISPLLIHVTYVAEPACTP